MKILYVLEYYFPYVGGSERLFKELAENMAKKGHEITVVTSLFSSDLPATEYINNVKVVRIKAKNRFSYTWKALVPVWRAASEADMIHTTTYNAALPAWLAGVLRRKKVILTFHEVWGTLWFKLPFKSYLQKLAYYTFERLVIALPFDRYVAVSKFTQNSLVKAGIKESKITQIYNGIDYGEFTHLSHSPNPQPPFLFVYFGRLGISKGLNLLLEAFARLFHERKDIRLILIVPKKPSDIWNQVNGLIDDLQVREGIIFYHNLERDELYRVLSSAHMAVIPSYSEGFCYSAVEAAAIGLPIIHSGRGALSEVLSVKKGKLNSLSSEHLYLEMCEALVSNMSDYMSRKQWPISSTVRQTESLYYDIKKGKH